MRNLNLTLAALALCTTATAQVQLQFKPLATIDLASTSNSANAEFIGSNPSAVAWDGADLIVAGFNGASSSANTGVVRVSNALTSPALGAAFGQLSTAASRGISGIAVQGGKIAVAWDNGSNSTSSWRLLNADGTLAWASAESGRGMAGIDFDPGFGGVDFGVNYLAQGSGRRRLADTAAGTLIYTSSNGAIINLSPLATGWRDHAFDPATGDLYTRVNNDVSKHTRTGGNAFSPNARIVDVTDVSTVAGQNIEFMDTVFGNILVYNDRASTGATTLGAVLKFIDSAGVAKTYSLGGLSAAGSTGYYDFSWDTANDNLAILDFSNRKVYVLQLCDGTDTDGDGTQDCVDGCPNDAAKIAPGQCGCGVADTDTDADGTADCNDGCPSDPLKIVAGICGCGTADTDTDADGTADCNDACPNDPLKIAAGQCGCGFADTDTDSDGTADCNDACPNDPLKIAAGQCGCGLADTDTDSDGTADCNDGCPNDPLKTAAGICGCGVADTDTDSDGTADCNDGCPNDPLKTAAGICGCGVADTDSDGDGTPNCNDLCPNDPTSTVPGPCGCGVAVTDNNGNGTPDCNEAIVRISQVYGAGGNTQAPLFSDYIEIYNAGGLSQSLSGWSVQYTSSTGTTWSVTALPAVTLGANQYLLVQQSTGATLPAGAVPANPTAQATGTIAMAADNAKIALVASTTALTGGTPTYATSANLRDFVGLGTANWNESAAAGLGAFTTANSAPAMSTGLAVYRRLGGAKDSNVNKNDFAVGYPSPRNSASTLGKGLAGIGVPFPLSVEETQVVRLLVTPFDVATNRPSAGLAVSADLSSIGGSATAALVDDGTSGDDLAGDGIFTLQTTVAAGTATGTKNLPLSFVDAAGKTGGTFLNLLVAPTSTPDNDNCLGAQALTIGTAVSGTYTGALPESNPMATAATPTSSAHSTRRGLWFSVTGTGNTLTASTCGTTPAVDSVMAVYVGTCDGLTQIVGGDDNGPACTSSTNASASWCSQLGANYLIWIAPYSGGPQTSAYNLVVNDSGTACSGALPASICTGVAGPYTEAEPGFGLATNDGCFSSPNGFTDIATPGYPGVTLRGTGRGMIGNRDVDSYRFQATVTDTIQILLNTLGTNAQAQLQKLSAGGACPSTALTPAANTPLYVVRCANGIQAVSAPVVAGDWYVINVITGVGIQQTPPATIFGGQMPGGKTYQYEMYVDIGAPPANNACANATALTTSPVVGNLQNATNDGASTCDATGKDVWYSFVAGGDAGTLNLETCGSATGDTVISVFDACGGNELACNDDNATCTNPLAAKLAFSLAANQSIRIRVSEKNTGAGAFTLTWSFVVPPPVNDECATATVLAAGSTSAVADTRFATPVTATAPASSCQTSQSRDIWFLWTSQGAGSVQVDTCGATQPNSDSVITVYTGSCGSLTQVACDDDTCATPGLGSQATFTATCTTTYIIRLSQYGTSVPATAWTLNVTAPGYIDTDGDGSNDCVDGCPNDANKTAPGICGCGVADTDSDGDGVANCNDGCPNDANKTAPGICGCGVADTDTDGDGVADCNDGCPNDVNKTAPGQCGCGVADTDTDGDLTADCVDGCPNDATKVAPGQCGCGVADTDGDGDGTADCVDGCPNDATKVAPGQCGCGVADTDSDGDGTADCNDLCPNDPLKVAPGTCGCGVADTDTDGDGVADCNDNCDAIANPGQGDCDLDGVGDACEIAAGTQLDTNLNGTPDSCELGAVFSYCTAGTTTNGCNASITAVGTPSASASAGFVVLGTGIEGQKQTLLYYGVSGPSAQVWATGSSSFKCVRQPVQRVTPQSSGGTVDTCSGTYAIDLANYLATRPTAVGNPRFAGEVFNAQLWFRDPPAPSTSSLSNALQFTLAP